MKKRTWTIYKIAFPNGKNYIGLTQDFNRRKYAHKRDLLKRIHRPAYSAMHHFGWNAVVFEKIQTGIQTLEEANELEKKYIVEYNSHITRNGYNCSEGGDGCLGTKISQERREKFIQETKVRWLDPAYRGKMKQASQSVQYTDEFRHEVSMRIKAHIVKNGHSWTGKNHKEESKEKMRGPRVTAKYQLASYYRGRRIYCSKLDIVFFSIKHCASFLGIRSSSLHQALNNPRAGKYESLTYYIGDGNG